MKKNVSLPGHHRWPGLRKMFVIMKLTTLFIVIALFQVSAKTYSQSTRLSLKFENATLESVFSKIEASSEFSIMKGSTTITNTK